MDQEKKKKLQSVFESCTSFVAYHPTKSMADWFDLLSKYIKEKDGSAKSDRYGDGDFLKAFEKEIAELLGKEAAVYMPSGTMAQQIALRIWSDKVKSKKIAMHPTSHLEGAEHYAYEYVHHLQRIQWGIPDFTANRLLTPKDFEGLKEIPGSVLLELPQRPIGGQLPTWDDLEKISQWCREHGVKLHLDGARLWESEPYYREHNSKTIANICELFDSVYVSFYKGLDGIAGCMLLGSQPFIDEAKIWQRRMGGNLPKMFPMYVAAKWGYETNYPLMTSYYEKAKELAAALNSIETGIFETVPKIPQSNMFHLYIKGKEEAIVDAILEVSEETGMWMIGGSMPTIMESYRWTELAIGYNSEELDMEKAIANFKKLAEKIDAKSVE